MSFFEKKPIDKTPSASTIGKEAVEKGMPQLISGRKLAKEILEKGSPVTVDEGTAGVMMVELMLNGYERSSDWTAGDHKFSNGKKTVSFHRRDHQFDVCSD